MGFSGVEITGYVASALVVASFAMHSVVRLRVVSVIGSVIIAVVEPGFALADDATAWLPVREGLPARVFIGRVRDDTLEVDLDYISARYHDSRLGQWLFGPGSKTLGRAGVSRGIATHPSPRRAARLPLEGRLHPAGLRGADVANARLSRAGACRPPRGRWVSNRGALVS